MNRFAVRTVALLLFCCCCSPPAVAADYHLDSFKRMQLTDVYYSEGANIGDINQDGTMDVVHGPYWFAGPDYKQAHEIYPPRPQPRERYADNFFSWVYDFDQDGWQDIFVVGFPGTPAYVYQNPGKQGFDKHWPKHQVFDWVSNESPHFIDLIGDERPELVCTRDGYFGYATIDWKQPFTAWKFHVISGQTASKRFGHGLGVGDVDGDQRADILHKDGWFQQPASLENDPQWKLHRFEFASPGGAEMHVYDVDGDGNNDVITSLAAHEFGLAWYEQLKDGKNITFRKHLIMGSKASENRYGLFFSELHTVNLADMDGDGLKDIVTGKTYWSHHKQSSLWDAGAVAYWFKLVRTAEGVNWIPYQADDDCGVGRQVIVGDMNGDQLPDIVAGGMKGCHVLIHQRQKVNQATWEQAQPQPPKEIKAGLSPQAAAAHMTVPSGFHVDLAAGEPQVHQPIAFTYDHRGRLWVAEAHTYPVRAPEGQGKDKIVILEDTTGDGKLDSQKVFMEGLNLVSGLEVGFGGVWVGAAPYLMFIPDKNGDDRPDGKPQILLDGFGYQDTHETLNAFIWGPDGWLYGCHGVFTHSRVGKPGTPDDQRTPLNAAVWRYHPTRHQFDVFARGSSNPWGVDFDQHGQAFITACVIPHLFHVIQGARYQRQGGQHFNPYVYDDLKTIADHAHYVGNIRDHAWWGGKEPTLPTNTSSAGGGHAHCGAMIYLADNWPEKYRNHIYFNNVHGNRVNSDILEQTGSGFVGRHGKDLLLANDQWFRGINLKYGPDGSVHLIDWYDKNACHRRTPEIWDRSNGRIYRIRYGETKHKAVDLSKLTNPELVKLQLHQNEWYVRTARRLLQERRAALRESDLSTIPMIRETVEPLREIMRHHDDPTRQLRAMWTLHSLDWLTLGNCLDQLNSPNEYVRSWAIQLMTERCLKSFTQLSGPAYRRYTELARQDPSPVVRLYLASTLQKIPPRQRWSIAAGLLLHAEDADDHNLPLMIWYGIEPLVTSDIKQALAMSDTSKIPLLKRYIIRRAATDNQTLENVISRLNRSTSSEEQLLFLEEILAAFQGRVNIPAPPAWQAAYEKLSQSNQLAVRNQADQVAVALGDRRIFPKLRKLVLDPKQEAGKRQQAMEMLIRGRDQQAAPVLQTVVSVQALRATAIRALAAYDDPRTAQVLLKSYGQLNVTERRDAINTLVSRPAYALALLDAVKNNQVPRTDIHAYNIRQLIRFDHEILKKRIASEWGQVRETSAEKQAQIAHYTSYLTPARLAKADLGNGRRLFAKSCAACHTLFDAGGKIGPNLTGSNRVNVNYILENMVDPSAVLGKDYRMTVIATADGRVISGLIQKETESALTLRTINDTVVIAKDDIDARKLSQQSMMPEGQLKQLKLLQVRDLVGYLASDIQVPLRGPEPPIDLKTGRVPNAIEAEKMTIVGKPPGRARSQAMSKFSGDTWSGAGQLWWTGAKPGDRLTLELPVSKAGRYDLEVVLGRARDYGIVQLLLDNRPLGGPIDLYNSPKVITTGVLTFGPLEISPGKHQFTIQIVGSHPKAIKSYMMGLDYVRLQPAVSASK